MNLSKLAIFASGTGSNAMNIIDFFKHSSTVEVAFVLCNKSDAKIIQSASQIGIPVIVVSNELIERGDKIIKLCEEHAIDYIILAGFLRKIPMNLIQRYPNCIINIHPSLLPKYGGKGMYGANVHRAVLKNNEVESGITIHFVNSNFDEGEIISQFKCQIDEHESLETLQHKIHQLEHRFFPEIISKTIEK